MSKHLHPLTPLVGAMMRSDGGCRICGEALTHHEFLGDQILAASRGGGKQMHRRCWEILSRDERNALATKWTIEDAVATTR